MPYGTPTAESKKREEYSYLKVMDNRNDNGHRFQ